MCKRFKIDYLYTIVKLSAILFMFIKYVHPQFLTTYSQVIRDLRQWVHNVHEQYIYFVSPNVVARIKQKYANRTDRDR